MSTLTWQSPAAGSLGAISEAVFYSQPLVASVDGVDTRPITYRLISGRLPPGMQVNVTGSLVGVPVVTDRYRDLNDVTIDSVSAVADISREYRFTIRATDSFNNVSDRTFALGINNLRPPVITNPIYNTPYVPPAPAQYSDMLSSGTDTLGGYRSGSKINIQFVATESSPSPTLTWSLVDGEIPNGLEFKSDGTMTGFLMPNYQNDFEITALGNGTGGGWQGAAWQKYPWEFDGILVDKYFYFTISVYDGESYALKSYSMFVYNRSGPSTSDVSTLTTDQVNIIVDLYGQKYNPLFLNTEGSLQTQRENSYFIYKFNNLGVANNITDNRDLDHETVKFKAIGTLPTGLTLDETSGWLYGFLPDQFENIKTYSFKIFIYKDGSFGPEDIYDELNIVGVGVPLYPSDVKTFTISVMGDIYERIIWDSATALGSIDNGTTSDLTMVAHADNSAYNSTFWTSNGVTVVDDLNTLTPDGLTHAETLISNSSISNYISVPVFLRNSTTGANEYTLSCYVKQGTSANVGITVYSMGSISDHARMNFFWNQTGAPEEATGDLHNVNRWPLSAGYMNVTSMGSGWYKIEFKVPTDPVFNNFQIRIFPDIGLFNGYAGVHYTSTPGRSVMVYKPTLTSSQTWPRGPYVPPSFTNDPKFISSITYILNSGSKLPQGLRLLPDGAISGRCTFEYFSLDQGVTTFDNNKQIFDNKFNLNITATGFNDKNEIIYSSNKDFVLTVNRINTLPYESLYLRALPSLSQRQVLNTLLTNDNLIPPELVYRNNDPYYGRAKNIKVLFLTGLKPHIQSEYQSLMATNHMKRTLQFSEIKTGAVRDDFGNIAYEVVYAELLDPLTSDQTKGPANTLDLTNQLTTGYMANGTEYKIATPSQLLNMNDVMSTGIGFNNRSTLPKWMTSTQFDGAVIGFKYAFVLCHVMPSVNQFNAGLIKNRLDNYFIANQTSLNELVFEVDRYQLDNELTANFNKTTEKFNMSSETTFDRINVAVGPYTAVVDYAVKVPFSSINAHSVDFINSNGGIDGMTNFQNGQTIIFTRHEGFTGVPSDGWLNIIDLYDDAIIGDSDPDYGQLVTDPTSTPALQYGYDASVNVPGYAAHFANSFIENQQASVWQITIDAYNIVRLISLAPTYQMNLNDTVFVTSGREFIGATLKYDSFIKPGKTVPEFTKISQYSYISRTATRFDNGSTVFLNLRDTYSLPNQKDKYLKFNKLGVFA